LRLHSSLYFVWGAIIVLLIAAHFVRRAIKDMRARQDTSASQSVE
jgi:hypothetical protein